MTAEQFLRGLFEADRNAADYYDRHPMYEGDALVDAKPWWPSLSEVWRAQGVRSEWDRNDHWGEAWALLQILHGDYVQSKSGARRR